MSGIMTETYGAECSHLDMLQITEDDPLAEWLHAKLHSITSKTSCGFTSTGLLVMTLTVKQQTTSIVTFSAVFPK
jgi:hypothetical protein